MVRVNGSGKGVHVMRGLALLVFAMPLVGCEDHTRPSSTLENLSEPGVLHVYVGGDGLTFVQGEPILTDAKILARAEDFHAKNPHGRVVVQSHEAAVHGRTVRVVDLLKEAEIQQVAVGVRREPSVTR